MVEIIKYFNNLFKFKVITKYILKEFLLTFIITFFFFFIIFLINSILLIVDKLLQKAVPLYLVLQFLITYFPMNIIFCLPFSIMLSTLMVMGRFSSDNEIVGFRACGFNYFKIFMPIFISSLIVGIITFFIYDRLVPFSTAANRSIQQKIIEIKPTIGFKSKTIKKHVNMTIYTDVVEDTEIRGLIIIDEDENKNKRIITAEKAIITKQKDRPGSLELRMFNAMLQFDNKDRPNEFNYGFCDELSYFIDFAEFDDSQRSYNIEKSTYENIIDINKFSKTYIFERNNIIKNFILLKENTKQLLRNNENFIKDNITESNFRSNFTLIDNNLTNIKSTAFNHKYKKIKDTGLNRSLIKLYQKFANPFACIIFAIFAAPIGIFSRRAGFSIGFIVGLFLSAFYWFSYMGLNVLSYKYVLKPFIAIFLPNLIFLILGLYFLFKRLRE